MDTPELAAIGEAQNSFVQFKRNVDVHPVFGLIRAQEEVPCTGEPNELTIETKVKREQTAIEFQEQIFPATIDRLNSLPFRKARELRRLLRLRSARVKDMNATNPAAQDERPQRSRDSFYFREFRHSS
jgi:hypothetical protein